MIRVHIFDHSFYIFWLHLLYDGKINIVQILGWLQQLFQTFQFFGFLRLPVVYLNTVYHRFQLSHSSSTSSIVSCDSDISTPFKSSDACVIRVSMAVGIDNVEVYKSIMVSATRLTVFHLAFFAKQSQTENPAFFCMLLTLFCFDNTHHLN